MLFGFLARASRELNLSPSRPTNRNRADARDSLSAVREIQRGDWKQLPMSSGYSAANASEPASLQLFECKPSGPQLRQHSVDPTTSASTSPSVSTTPVPNGEARAEIPALEKVASPINEVDEKDPKAAAAKAAH